MCAVPQVVSSESPLRRLHMMKQGPSTKAFEKLCGQGAKITRHEEALWARQRPPPGPALLAGSRFSLQRGEIAPATTFLTATKHLPLFPCGKWKAVPEMASRFP
jgi:hypothetical protein